MLFYDDVANQFAAHCSKADDFSGITFERQKKDIWVNILQLLANIQS